MCRLERCFSWVFFLRSWARKHGGGLPNTFEKHVFVSSGQRAISLTDIESTSFGKEATKQHSSIVTILASNYCTFESFKDK